MHEHIFEIACLGDGVLPCVEKDSGCIKTRKCSGCLLWRYGKGRFQAEDRVQVNIADRERYAVGCAAALDRKLGTVERVRYDGEVLVRFDSPAPTWWANQSPVTAFWFPTSDLAIVSAAL